MTLGRIWFRGKCQGLSSYKVENFLSIGSAIIAGQLSKVVGMFSLSSVFEDLPVVQVVDIGASPFDGEPIFDALRAAGGAEVLGFEPSPDQYEKLLAMQTERATFLPYAIGDGTEGELKICRAPGMTSMLEPDLEVLSHFHQLKEAAEILERQSMATHRLDDIAEAVGMDFLKVDVQGGEQAVFEGAKERLADACFIHTEVQFVPFYKGQALFAELDQILREAGFWFHRLDATQSRVFKPLMINNDVFGGLSQQLWSDAVYVKRFVDFPKLETEQLLKIALLAHDIYASYDLAMLALQAIDRREGTSRHTLYLERLTPGASTV
jgi:FkbM family methyltransferase